MFGKRSDQPRSSDDRARAAADRAARRAGRPLPAEAFEHSVRPPDIEPRSPHPVEPPDVAPTEDESPRGPTDAGEIDWGDPTAAESAAATRSESSAGDAPRGAYPASEATRAEAPAGDAAPDARAPRGEAGQPEPSAGTPAPGIPTPRREADTPTARGEAGARAARGDAGQGESAAGAAAARGEADTPTARGEAGARAARGDAGQGESAAGAAAARGEADTPTARGEAGARAARGDAGQGKSAAGAAVAGSEAGTPTARGEAGTPTARGEAGTPTARGEAGTPTARGEAGTPTARGDSGQAAAGAAGAAAARDEAGPDDEARGGDTAPPVAREEQVHQPTVEYTPSFHTEEHELFGDPRDGEPELVAARGQAPRPEVEEEPQVFEPKPLRPAPDKPATAEDAPRKRPAPNAPKRRNKRRSPPPPRAPRGSGKTHWGRRFVALILLLVILALFYVINATFQPFHGDGTGEVKVTIPQGADAGEAGKLLAAKGVIDSARFFELKATIGGDRGNLRPGDYTLKKGMKNGAVLAAITKVPETTEAPVETVKLTIVEGPSRKENAKVVDDSDKVEGSYLKATASKGVLERIRKLGAPKGTKTAEGFLFPATYELPKGSKASALVDEQLDAFEENFKQVDMKYAKSKNLSRYDVLVIASMIEREAQLAKERPLVSAVIYNRLKEGMPLQIDATIRYFTNNWTRQIKQSELDADEPYNLSINRGLPPTPIGNPGLASLKAAAKPSKKSYLYYVRKANDKSGEHAFSSTDAEFAKDLKRYQESLKDGK